jgi:hypothetical protein
MKHPGPKPGSACAATDQAPVNLGTLWRIKIGCPAPAWPRFTRLVGAAGVHVEPDYAQSGP